MGSYTELKHDTILYGVMLYGAIGNMWGGEPPPVPKGFVEPNLRFWEGFLRLVDFTIEAFEKHDILREERESYGTLPMFRENVEFLYQVARKELSGKPVSDDEYERLRTMDFKELCVSGNQSVEDELTQGDSGLIADVYTSLATGEILYEATAEPYLMLVLIGDQKTPRLVIGLAYNHVEFKEPIGRRIDDATWRGMAYQQPRKTPPKNFWYRSLVVPVTR